MKTGDIFYYTRTAGGHWKLELDFDEARTSPEGLAVAAGRLAVWRSGGWRRQRRYYGQTADVESLQHQLEPPRPHMQAGPRVAVVGI